MSLVVNQATDSREGAAAQVRLVRTALQLLNLTVEPCGIIPRDDVVPRAVRAQTPVLLGYPPRRPARASAALPGGSITGRSPSPGSSRNSLEASRAPRHVRRGYTRKVNVMNGRDRRRSYRTDTCWPRSGRLR